MLVCLLPDLCGCRVSIRKMGRRWREESWCWEKVNTAPDDKTLITPETFPALSFSIILCDLWYPSLKPWSDPQFLPTMSIQGLCVFGESIPLGHVSITTDKRGTYFKIFFTYVQARWGSWSIEREGFREHRHLSQCLISSAHGGV